MVYSMIIENLRKIDADYYLLEELDSLDSFQDLNKWRQGYE